MPVTCTTCGREIQRQPGVLRGLAVRGITQFFCNRRCRYAFQVIDLPISVAIEYRAGASTNELGLSYGVSGAKVAKTLHQWGVPVRSRGFGMAGPRNPTLGKGHTEKTRLKLRAANARQFADPEARARHSSLQVRLMAEGRVKKTSAVEDAVADLLQTLGITYQRLVGIRNPVTGQWVACVDFLLSAKTVLEVQGDFWHSNPKLYPRGPQYASQRHVAKNDRRKRAALDELGFRVLYVWESDVKERGAQAVTEVLDV